MKREKDNTFIIINEDITVCSPRRTIKLNRTTAPQKRPQTRHPQASDSPTACSDNQLSQPSPKTPCLQQIDLTQLTITKKTPTKHHQRTVSRNITIETILPLKHHLRSHSSNISLETVPPIEYHQRTDSPNIAIKELPPTKHHHRSHSHNITPKTMPPQEHHQGLTPRAQS